MSKAANRDILFQILLDSDAGGLTLIQGAPIHTTDDFLRARAELSRIAPAGSRIGGSSPAHPRR